MFKPRDWGLKEGPLGLCPECKVTIPGSNLLIKYIPDEGWPRLCAKCPDCERPVHPE